jgi:hypothetical protein
MDKQGPRPSDSPVHIKKTASTNRSHRQKINT